MKKKILVTLLSFVMVVTMMPLSVFANTANTQKGETNATTADLKVGDQVQLPVDNSSEVITQTGAISADGYVTFNVLDNKPSNPEMGDGAFLGSQKILTKLAYATNEYKTSQPYGWCENVLKAFPEDLQEQILATEKEEATTDISSPHEGTLACGATELSGEKVFLPSILESWNDTDQLAKITADGTFWTRTIATSNSPMCMYDYSEDTPGAPTLPTYANNTKEYGCTAALNIGPNAQFEEVSAGVYKWIPGGATTHTVTFDPDNGQEKWNVTVEDGATVDKPSDPSKEGHSFVGWFEDGAETSFDFSTPITADLTLTAHWQARESHNIKKGISDHVESFTIQEAGSEGQKINLPDITTESGFEFDKWYVTCADKTPVVVEGDKTSGYYFTMPNQDVTVVAAVNKYKLSSPPVVEHVEEITGLPEIAVPGQTVNFDVVPEEGYEVKEIQYTHPETGEKVTVETEKTGLINGYSFVMPIQDVLVTPIMQKEGSDDYLSFTARGGDAFIQLTDTIPMSLVYSSDKENWKKFQGAFTVRKDSTVYLKLKDGATPRYPGAEDRYDRFVITADEGTTVEAGGNIMSLVSNDLLNADTIEEDYGFNCLFLNATALTTAPKLPATNLSAYCYQGMFGMSGITSAPELPAEELSDYCYCQMFAGSAITSAPDLPAKELKHGCYQLMFMNCDFVTPPKMLAETLAEGSCRDMFLSCTSLKSTPELFARDLAETCYKEMFKGCSALEEATVHFEDWNEGSCEAWMSGVASEGTFNCRNGLQEIHGVDNIPNNWTINHFGEKYHVEKGLSEHVNEFTLPVDSSVAGATVDLPEVTTKAGYTFSKWNIETSSGDIVEPQQRVDDSWYFEMPEDDVTVTAVVDHYNIYGATVSHATIEGLPTQSGAGSNVEFTVNPEEGWEVKEIQYTLHPTSDLDIINEITTSKQNGSYSFAMPAADILVTPMMQTVEDGDYLSFTARGGAATIEMDKAIPMSLVYSFNKDGKWSDFVQGGGEGAGVTVPKDSTMYLRIKDTAKPVYPGISDTIYNKLTMTAVDEGATIEAGGNIMSLVSHNLSSADTIEAEYGFYSLFSGCEILTTSPKLPATNLAQACYASMFGSSGITSAPALPAEELSNYCYYQMFAGCASLETPPEMLAKTLAVGCCENMFFNCTSLTSSPELFASDLVDVCYKGMFGACSNLNEITVHFKNWYAADYPTNAWVNGVASSGTFNCRNDLEKRGGDDGIPTNWTINRFYEEHSITKGISDHVTSFEPQSKAREHDEVNLPTEVTVEDGYTFKGWDIKTAGGETVTPQQRADESWYFEMPDDDVVVTAVVDHYNIYGTTVAHATIEGLSTQAVAGSNVEFTVTPDQGWAVKEIQYTLHPTSGLDITNKTTASKQNGSYSFTMPIADVSVTPLMRKVAGDDYLSFTAKGGSATIQLSNEHSMDLEYSFNKESGWADFIQGDQGQGVTISKDQTMYLKLKVTGESVYPTNEDGTNKFIMSGDDGTTVEAGGNIMSLVSTDLPSADTIEKGSGFEMLFNRCSILTKPPELPATTLEENCYSEMFSRSGITSAPNLPAKELKDGCYASMFANCASLKTPPEMLAETIGFTSCATMFAGCTSLESSPEIFVKNLEMTSCYQMFYGCTQLSEVTVHFEDWNTIGMATTMWLGNVASSGTFYCPPGLPEARGTSNIPEDWTIERVGGEHSITKGISDHVDPFALPVDKAIEGIEINLPQVTTEDDYTFTKWSIETSEGETVTPAQHEDQSWYFVMPDDDVTVTAVVDKYDVKAADVEGVKEITGLPATAAPGAIVNFDVTPEEGWKVERIEYNHPKTGEKVTVETEETGKINGYSFEMPMQDVLVTPVMQKEGLDDYLSFTAKDGDATIKLTNDNAMSLMYSFNKQDWFDFEQGTEADKGVNVSEGETVYLKLADKADPVYPATNRFVMLGDDGVTVEAGGNIMSLVSHDVTTADTVEQEKGFTGLFFECAKLKTAPKLPATTLAANCYQEMFNGSGITKAPELPAKELKDNCYQAMFAECASLETPPKMLAETLAEECCADMFSACTSLTAGPELFATELKTGCYNGMFSGCSDLNEITVHFEDWGGVFSPCTYEWVSGVAAEGIFYCPPSLEEDEGQSRIPDGWTVKSSYNITPPTDLHHGTAAITVDDEPVTAAYQGDTVQLTYTATDPGWEVSEWTVTPTAGGDPIPVTADGTFEMPDAAVTVAATEAPTGYNITLPEKDHGLVTATVGTESVTTAHAGDTVQLAYTAKAESPGWRGTNWKVVKTNEETTEVPVSAEGEFEMPAYAVTVTVDEEQFAYVVTKNAPHGTIALNPEQDVYGEGTEIELAYSSEIGYKLSDWKVTQTGDPAMEVPVTDNKFRMPAYPVTVTAVEEQETFEITIPEDICQHGTVTAEVNPVRNAQTAHYGDTVKLTYEATDPGWAVSEWKVEPAAGGDPIPVTAEGTFEMPADDVTIKADETQTSFTITVTQPEHGTIAIDPGKETYDAGDEVALSYTSGLGYEVDNWVVVEKGTGTLVTVTDDTFTMPASDVTVSVVEKQIKYNINLPTDLQFGAAHAEVGGVTVQSASQGETVQLVYEPTNPGYKVTAWTVTKDGGGDPIPVTPDGEFTMPMGAVTVAATEGKIDYNIELPTNLVHGTVSAGVTPVSTHNDPTACVGDTVKLTYTATDPGWKVSTWTVTKQGGEPVDVDEDGEFEMPAAAVTVSAEEVQYAYVVKKAETHHGEITLYPPATGDAYEPGQEVTLGYTSSEGYEVEQWAAVETGGTRSVEVTDSKFIMPAFPVTVIPTEKPIDYDITLPALQHGTPVATVDETATTVAHAGDSVQLSYIPTETGYRVTEWKVVLTDEPTTEVPVSGGAFTMPAEDVTVIATESNKYSITVITPDHGQVTSTATTAEYGSEVTFTATPNTGYSFKEFTITAGTVTYHPTENPAKMNMPAYDVTVTAEFTQTDHAISIAEKVPPHGVTTATVSGAPVETAHYGEEVKLETTMEEGYTFGQYTVAKAGGEDPVSVGTDGKFTMPDYDVVVTATETQNEYDITVVNPDTHVTITTDPATKAHFNDEVNLSAAMDEGWAHGDYIITKQGGGTVEPQERSDGTWYFVMPSDNVTVTASESTQIDYSIAITDPEHGTIEASIEGASVTTAHFGEEVALSISLDDGWALKNYVVETEDGDPVHVTAEGTFNMPSKNVKVTAELEQIEYEISITDLQHAKIASDPAQKAHFKETVTLSIEVETGYTFDKYVVTGKESKDDIPVTADGTFEMPLEGVDVTASLTQNEYDINITNPVPAHGSTNAIVGGTAATKAHYGETVKLETTMEEGYSLDAYTVKETGGEGEVTVATDGTFTMPDYPVTVTAKDKHNEYKINISGYVPAHGGTAAYKGEDQVSSAYFDDTITLYTVMQDGWTLGKYTVTPEGESPIELEGNTFKMPSKDVTITATETQNEYDINIKNPVPTHGTTVASIDGKTVNKAHYQDKVKLTTTMQDGYTLDKYTVTKLDKTGTVTVNDEGIFVMPLCGVEVTASEIHNEYSIGITPHEHGETVATVNGKTVDKAHYQDKVKLVSDMEEGYSVEKYTVLAETGEEVTVAPDGTFVMPLCAVKVEVEVRHDIYKITINNPQPEHGGTVAKIGSDIVTQAYFGDTITLTTVMYDGWTLGEYTVTKDGGGTVDVDEDGTFEMPTDNITITATETHNEYDITIDNPQPLHGNTVSIVDGKESKIAHYQDKVTLKTTMSPGYSFGGYTVTKPDGGTVTVASDGTFVMPLCGVKVVASESAIVYKIDTVSTHGDVVTKVEGEVSSEAIVGQNVTLSYENADPGWILEGWKVTKESGGDVTVIGDAFVMPADNVTVTAIEKQVPFKIALPVLKHGTAVATVDGKSVQEALEGKTVTLSYVNPDPEWLVTEWVVTDMSGSKVVPVTGDTFTMPAYDVKVTATEKENHKIKVKECDHVTNIDVSKDKTYEGDEVQVIATAEDSIDNPIKRIHIVPEDGSSEIVIENESTFVMPNCDVSVYAEATKYFITSEDDTNTEHGTVVITTPEQPYGATASFKVKDIEEGYEIKDIEILRTKTGGATGIEVTPYGSSFNFTNPMYDTTVKVTIDRIVHNISVVNPEHCTIDVQSIAYEGETVTINSKVDKGYEVTAYTLDGAILEGNTFTMPTHDVEVSAIVEPLTFNINISQPAVGTINGPPTALMAEEVSVTYVPVEGSGIELENFVIYDEDGQVSFTLSGNTATFTVRGSDVYVSAIEKEIDYDVNITPNPHGKITATPSPAHKDNTVRLTCEPDEGYELYGYEVINDTTKEPIKVSQSGAFKMPASSVTVIADIDLQGHNIVITPASHGSAVADTYYSSPGKVITVVSTPDEGYKLEKYTAFTKDSKEPIDIDITTGEFTMPSEDVIIVPSFVKDTYSIKINAAEHGKITTDPASKQLFDEKVTLNYTPLEAGWSVSKWNVVTATGDVITVSGSTFTMPAEAVTVSAVETQSKYNITVTDGTTSGGRVECQEEAAPGEVVTMKPIANKGYGLSELTVTNTATGRLIQYNDDYEFVMPEGDVAIYDEFDLNTYSVNVEQSSYGTIVASPLFGKAGDEISVSATPKEGYKVSKLTFTPEGGEAQEIKANKFNMPEANVTVKATYDKVSYTVTVVDGKHGTLQADPKTQVQGGKVNLEYTPVDPGWELDAFTVDGKEITSSSFTMPAHNVTVSVKEKEIGYDINVINPVTAQGTVKTEPSDTQLAGREVQIIATPNYGYEIEQYVVTERASGTQVDVTQEGKFVMPTDDVDVQVTFKELVFEINMPDPTKVTGGKLELVSPEGGKAKEGELVKLKATSDEGYKFLGFKVYDKDLEVVEMASSTTFVMPASDVTVTGEFTAVSYSITVVNPEHGNIITSQTTATIGTTISLDYISNEGYEVDKYSVTMGKTPIVVENNKTFVMPGGNVTVTATEKLTQHDVVVNKVTGGTVTADPKSCGWGEIVKLSHETMSGYEFVLYEVETKSEGQIIPVSADGSFVMPNDDVYVTGIFIDRYYNVYTYGSTGVESIVATPDMQIAGKEVALTYNLIDGYEFVSFEGTYWDEETQSIKEVEFTGNKFVMPKADVAVTVHAEKEKYQITIMQDQEKGIVSADPGSAEIHSSVQLSYQAKPGWDIEDYTIIGTDVERTISKAGIFDMPGCDITVIPNWVQIPYRVDTQNPSHGTLETTPSKTANVGDKVKITSEFEPGWELDEYKVETESGTFLRVSPDGTFTMPAEDVRVSASERLSTYDVTIMNPNHAKISATPAQATMGKTVKLTSELEKGYELTGYVVLDIDSNLVDVDQESGTFVMPVGGVWVTAAVSHTEYSVAVDQPEHGTIEVSPAMAYFKDQVEVSFTPDEGYEEEAIYYVPDGEKPIRIIANSFTMPDKDVTVYAETSLTKYSIVVYQSQYGTLTATPSDFATVEDDVKLSFEPKEGYVLDHYDVTSKGKEIPVSHDGVFHMPAGDVEVSATVDTKGYNVDLEQVEHAIIKSDLLHADYQEVVTLSSDIEEGYQFKNYEVIGQESGKYIPVSLNGTFTMPAEDVTAKVAVAPTNYSVAVSTPQYGELTAEPATELNVGDNVKLTYTEDATSGWELSHYEVTYQKDGKEVNVPVSNDGTFIMPASNVEARAVLQTVPYKVNLIQPEYGYITSDKDYASVGDTVALTFTAKEGYDFVGFEVMGPSGRVQVKADGTFTMPAGEVIVSAEVEAIQYGITVNSPSQGTITSSETKAVIGDSVQLTFDPKPGYVLDKYQVINDKTKEEVKVFTDGTFLMPASSVTVTATAIALDYNVKVEQTDHAYIFASGEKARVDERVYLGASFEKGYFLGKYIVTSEEGEIPVKTDAETGLQYFEMPAGDVTVTAKVLATKYSIGIENPVGGVITSDPEKYQSCGDVVSLSFEAYEGYEFDRYYVSYVEDGKEIKVPVTSEGQFVMPASNVTVTAITNPIEYRVDIVQPEHAHISADCEVATIGKEVNLSIDCEPGYELEYFQVNGMRISGNSFIMMAGDAEVTAVTRTVTYTIHTNDSIGGKVSADRFFATVGEKVHLSFDPNPGYELNYFGVYTKKGTEPVFVSVDGTFEMPADSVEVYAYPRKVTYAVELNQPEHGKIESSIAYATLGTEVKLSFTPDKGYDFANYVVTYKDDPSKEVEVNYDGTFIMPAATVVATAETSLHEFEITKLSSKHGEVFVQGSATMGETVHMSAKAEEGWQLKEIVVKDEAGTSQPVVDNSFLMPASNVTVQGVFEPIDVPYVPGITGFSASAPDCKSIEINWDESSDSRVHYWLYRGDLPAGDWGEPYQKLDYGQTQFVDTNVTAGKKYYYVMRAAIKVGDEWVFGDYSKIDYGYPRPHDIQNFKAKADTAAAADISWSQDKEKGVKYFLYKSTTPTGDWGPRLAVLDNNHNYYHDTDVTNGTKYYYMVRGAYQNADGSYAFGNYTKVDYAWPRVIPVNDLKSWATDSKTAKLTWTRSSQSNLKYYIYRGTKPYGDWGSPIATVSGDKSSYTDKNLTKGQKYYYLVKVGQEVDGKMYYSEYSNMDYAWPR